MVRSLVRNTALDCSLISMLTALVIYHPRFRNSQAKPSRWRLEQALPIPGTATVTCILLAIKQIILLDTRQTHGENPRGGMQNCRFLPSASWLKRTGFACAEAAGRFGRTPGQRGKCLSRGTELSWTIRPGVTRPQESANCATCSRASITLDCRL
jgi:hypothetical protein